MLDEITPGDGNCFPHAVVQHCRRREIKENILKSKPIKVNNFELFRHSVCDFMLNVSHPCIESFRQSYNLTEYPVSRISWNDYWFAMRQNNVWVDYKFIQGTAWYLSQDILIVTKTVHQKILTSTSVEIKKKRWPTQPTRAYNIYIYNQPKPTVYTDQTNATYANRCQDCFRAGSSMLPCQARLPKVWYARRASQWSCETENTAFWEGVHLTWYNGHFTCIFALFFRKLSRPPNLLGS